VGSLTLAKQFSDKLYTFTDQNGKCFCDPALASHTWERGVGLALGTHPIVSKPKIPVRPSESAPAPRRRTGAARTQARKAGATARLQGPCFQTVWMERVDSGLVTVMANRRFPGSHITRLSEAPIRRLRRPDMPALKAEFGYRDVCAPGAIAKLRRCAGSGKA